MISFEAELIWDTLNTTNTLLQGILLMQLIMSAFAVWVYRKRG